MKNLQKKKRDDLIKNNLTYIRKFNDCGSGTLQTLAVKSFDILIMDNELISKLKDQKN